MSAKMGVDIIDIGASALIGLITTSAISIIIGAVDLSFIQAPNQNI